MPCSWSAVLLCVAGGAWAAEECFPGTYSFTAGSSCKWCPRHATCPGGKAVLAARGYWRGAADSSKIVQCPFYRYCAPHDLLNTTSPDAQCRSGHVGPACATCAKEDRLDPFTGKCFRCTRAKRQRTIGILTFGAGMLAVVVIVVFLVRWWCVRVDLIVGRHEKVTPVLKLLLVFAQTTAFLGRSIPGARTPPALARYQLGAAMTFGVDVATVFRRSCLGGDLDYLDAMLVTTLGPLLAGVVVISLVALVSCCQLATKSKRRKLRSHATFVLLVVSYVALSTVSRSVARTFQCDRAFKDGPYDDEYLVADYAISCTTRRYRLYRLYASMMVAVYSLGIPLLFLVQLLSVKRRIAPKSVRALARAVLSAPAPGGGADDNNKSRWHSSSSSPSDEKAQRLRDLSALAARFMAEDDLHKKTGKVQSSDAVGFGCPPHFENKIPEDGDGDPTTLRGVSLTVCSEHDGGVVHNAPTVVLDALGDQLVVASRELDESCRPFRFLFREYHRDFWWFEVLECSRRLSLACVLPLPGVDAVSFANPILATVLVLSYAALYAHLKPFVSHVLDSFSTTLQIILFINVFCLLVVSVDQNADDREFELGIKAKHFGNFLVFVNCSAIVWALLAIVVETEADIYCSRRLGTIAAASLKYFGTRNRYYDDDDDGGGGRMEASCRRSRRSSLQQLGEVWTYRDNVSLEGGVIHPTGDYDEAEDLDMGDNYYDLIGEQVVIAGLETRPDMNGRTGYVEDFNIYTGRFKVVCGSNAYLLKPQNIQQEDFHHSFDYDSE